MRVILDTNVVVSGVFFSGPPHVVLKAWHKGRIELVVSRPIYDEYERVASAYLQQGLYDVLRCLSGARVRPSGFLFKARRAFSYVPVHPFISGLSADSISVTELGKATMMSEIISDKLGLLVHGQCLTPGHGAPPEMPRLSSKCYPCLPTKVLPMCPDRTIGDIRTGLKLESGLI